MVPPALFKMFSSCKKVFASLKGLLVFLARDFWTEEFFHSIFSQKLVFLMFSQLGKKRLIRIFGYLRHCILDWKFHNIVLCIFRKLYFLNLERGADLGRFRLVFYSELFYSNGLNSNKNITRTVFSFEKLHELNILSLEGIRDFAQKWMSCLKHAQIYQTYSHKNNFSLFQKLFIIQKWEKIILRVFLTIF